MPGAADGRNWPKPDDQPSSLSELGTKHNQLAYLCRHDDMSRNTIIRTCVLATYYFEKLLTPTGC